MTVALQASAITLLVLACVLAVPAFVLLLQVSVAVLARSTRSGLSGGEPRPSVAVLMPAHDEAAGITAAIASVLPQLRVGDRLLVVADNCGDDTAAVARAAGAEVAERHDPLRRGKGYALDFGIRALESRPPCIVVMVDADCVAEAGSLERLVLQCVCSQRPVQALYLMRSPLSARLPTRISEFAWVVKNQVRPIGFLRLGLPCQLMGTGMAFPWELARKAPLASGHLVEDMQLGLDLALRGSPPLFCPDACVTSIFPASPSGAMAQRTRWEHGHLSMIVAQAPRLFWHGIIRLRLDLIAMAFDLCVPPLAWLALMVGAVTTVSAAFFWWAHFASPFIVSLGSAVAIGLATAMAWRSFGQPILSLGELFSAPAYAFAKLPIYAKFVTKKQSDWVRARRDGE